MVVLTLYFLQCHFGIATYAHKKYIFHYIPVAVVFLVKNDFFNSCGRNAAFSILATADRWWIYGVWYNSCFWRWIYHCSFCKINPQYFPMDRSSISSRKIPKLRSDINRSLLCLHNVHYSAFSLYCFISSQVCFLSLVKNCNHKRLGIYYLLSAYIFGVTGTLISVLMRIVIFPSHFVPHTARCQQECYY